MPEMQGLEKRLLQSSLWKALTQRVTLPWALRAGPLPEQADVLEVGSGGGFNAEVFLGRFPDWRLTASDYDPDMVERARAHLGRFGGRVGVERADATSLAFPGDSFDLVISIFVWHHVGDWRKATAECARVLRPGGSLLLVDLTSSCFPRPVAKLFPPAAYYALSELRDAMQQAGFIGWEPSTIGPFLYRVLAQSPTALADDPASELGQSDRVSGQD